MAYTTPLVTLTEGFAVNGGTSSAVDTTGADLLLVAVSHYSAGSGLTVTDSKSNTWTARSTSGDGDSNCTLFECVPSSVGAGHTFTAAGAGIYPALSLQAWAGAHAAPFDQQSDAGSGAGVTSIQAGSVTPSEANELIVAAMANGTDAGTGRSINSSFTISGQIGFNSGQYFPVAMAYFVQGSAAAINPTWSWSGSTQVDAVIATFKAAAGGGGNRRRRLLICG
jgi:hypothetical protein